MEERRPLEMLMVRMEQIVRDVAELTGRFEVGFNELTKRVDRIQDSTQELLSTGVKNAAEVAIIMRKVSDQNGHVATTIRNVEMIKIELAQHQSTYLRVASLESSVIKLESMAQRAMGKMEGEGKTWTTVSPYLKGGIGFVLLALAKLMMDHKDLFNPLLPK